MEVKARKRMLDDDGDADADADEGEYGRGRGQGGDASNKEKALRPAREPGACCEVDVWGRRVGYEV